MAIVKTNINTQEIQKLINNHNSVVNSLKTLDIKVPIGNFFPAMQLWSYIAFEGYDIVSLARSIGINVKCNMQDGEITFYNQEFLYEVDFERYSICVKSSDEKLSIEVATAHLQADIEKNGKIIKITPITKEEADKFYDMSNYPNWPLIG